jgi:hypothetical protein
MSNIPGAQVIDEETTPLADEIFNAVLLIVPFSFLLLMMEMFVSFLSGEPTLTETPWQSSLIHFQYGKRPSLQALVDRMAPGIPSMCNPPLYVNVQFTLCQVLSIFIFYSQFPTIHRSSGYHSDG